MKILLLEEILSNDKNKIFIRNNTTVYSYVSNDKIKKIITYTFFYLLKNIRIYSKKN